jgi:predicted transcriptional regulator
MNPFKRWLDGVGVRPSAIAKILGISRGEVARYCREGYWPARHIAERMRRVSGGDVSIDDFLDLTRAACINSVECDEMRIARAAASRAKTTGRSKGKQNGKETEKRSRRNA